MGCVGAPNTTHADFYMSAHSLIVAVLKYIIIIHWKKFGKYTLKELFFFLNFLHPIFTITIQLIIRPDFFWAWDGYAQIDRCLGDPKNNWGPGNNKSQTKLHNICDIAEPPEEDYFDYTVYTSRWGTCWIQVICLYLITFNLFDILIYCRIFIFMKR